MSDEITVSRLEQVSGWKRALNKARRTIGKEEIDKEPSDSWKAKMLLAEHSPIRMVEYDWTWENIEMWVTVHFVRHNVGCEKFVSTQRTDRTGIDRYSLPQSSLNNMDMTANAQSIMNISRKRLCSCASKETNKAWKLVIEKIREIDPILADKCVPECQYRNFCPEWMKSCGYINTSKYQIDRVKYLRVDYNDYWTPIKGYEGFYEISRFGIVRSVDRQIYNGNCKKRTVYSKYVSITCNKKRSNYCYVHLFKEGKEKCIRLHRLVAMTFIPNPDCKPEVNHIDGNKFNNQVSNLEWVTSTENKSHGWRTGLYNSNHSKVKIKCIENNNTYSSVIECSKILNIDKSSIFKQLRGKIKNAKGYTFERVT